MPKHRRVIEETGSSAQWSTAFHAAANKEKEDLNKLIWRDFQDILLNEKIKSQLQREYPQYVIFHV